MPAKHNTAEKRNAMKVSMTSDMLTGSNSVKNRPRSKDLLLQFLKCYPIDERDVMSLNIIDCERSKISEYENEDC